MSESRAQSVDAMVQSADGTKADARKPMSGSLFKKNGSTIQSVDQNSTATRKSVQILLNSADINRKSKQRIRLARNKL